MPIHIKLPVKETATIAGFTKVLDKTFSDTLLATIHKAFGNLATTFSSTIEADLTTLGQLKPGDGKTEFALAMGHALEFGTAAHAIAEILEVVQPLKNMGFGQVAALMAEFSGFRELVSAYHGPLVHNAIRVPSMAEFAAKFRSRPPGAAEAAQWEARGIIADGISDDPIAWSGLMPEYQEAFKTAMYRPVPPFLLARAAEAGVIPKSDLDSALQFAGFRPADITMLERAYAGLALLPYETRYLQSVERSVELGTDTPAALTSAMNSINLSQQAQSYVQLTVAELKLHNLTELYRKSVSESYKYGTTTDAQYVPSLEAIGMDPAEAQGYYAIDSIAKQGKILAAELRAEERLANQQKSAAMRAAIAEFRSGTIDAAALEAALLLAGIDPMIASYAVVVQTARQQGTLVLVYGLELGRTAALLLHEKVTALGRQVAAQLVSPAEALVTLSGLGIPGANAEALVAGWAATHTAASTVGVKEPL